MSKVKDKVVAEAIKQIEAKGGHWVSSDLMDQIVRQAVICGSVTIKFNYEEKLLEIVDPFKGCNCNE